MVDKGLVGMRESTIVRRHQILKILVERAPECVLTSEISRLLTIESRNVGAYLWQLQKEELVQGRRAGLPKPADLMKEWRVRPSKLAQVREELLQAGVLNKEDQVA